MTARLNQLLRLAWPLLAGCSLITDAGGYSIFERWQEAARQQGRSLSNWVKLELERAAAAQDAENERLADEAVRRGIALRSEG